LQRLIAFIYEILLQNSNILKIEDQGVATQFGVNQIISMGE